MFSAGFNGADGVAVAIVLLSAIFGLWRGLASEIGWLLALGAAGVGVVRFTAPVADALASRGLVGEAAADAVAMGLIVAAVLAVFLIASLLLRGILKVVFVERLNRVGGVAFGLVRGCLLVALMFVMAGLWPGERVRHVMLEESVIGRQVKRVLPRIRREVAPSLPLPDAFDEWDGGEDDAGS